MSCVFTNFFNSFSRFAAGKQAGLARCGQLETTTTSLSTRNSRLRSLVLPSVALLVSCNSNVSHNVDSKEHVPPITPPSSPLSSESPVTITRDTHFFSDSENLRRPRSEFITGFAAYLRDLAVSDNASSFDEQRQRERAQQMHAMVGNKGNRRPRRNREPPNPPVVKAAIKEEVKQEVRKEVAKENKQTRKQRRPVTVRKGQKVVIRGSGDYDLGTNLGSKIGGWLGGRIHKWVGGLFGHGDYEVVQPDQGINSNSLMASASMPQFSGEVGVVRYRFSEWLGYAPVETKFTPTTFPIDCTSRRTFPYSHPIARLFQQYKIHGLIFAVNSNMSIYSNSPTLGTLFGSVRYDVDSQPPASKNEVMNSLFSATAKSSGNLVFPVECAPGQTALRVFKVRQPGRAAGDEQFYMLGYFDLCSDGASVAAAKGSEVTAVYDIEFVKPRLEAGAGFYVFMADCKCDDATKPLKYIPNSVAVTQPRLNTAGLTTSEDGIISFPYDYEAGTLFKVTYSFYNAANGISVAVGNQKHLTTPPFAYNQATTLISSGPATAAGGLFSNIIIFVVRMTGTATVKDPPSIKLGYGGTMTGPGLLLIEEIDPRVASGLIAIDEEPYTRQEFIEYLENVQVGSEGVARAPDYSIVRLVDVVDALMRSPQIILGSTERCNIEYDIGVTEALDRLKVYRVKPRLIPMDTKLPPVSIRKNLSYVPMDEKGNEGDEILMMASPELIRSFGLVTHRQLSALGVRAKARVTHEGRTFYVPEDDFEVTSQISGANGEWTGTDDVQKRKRALISELETTDFEVNGYLLPWDDYNAAVELASREGDVYPTNTFVRHDLGWSTIVGCSITPAGLTPVRTHHLSYKLLRRIQCFMRTGLPCTHGLMQCPGHRRLVNLVELYRQRLRTSNGFAADVAFLNGTHGEYTCSDDVFSECKNPCPRPRHCHPFARPALEAAARRIAEAQKKEEPRPALPKYYECTIVAYCPEPVHFHPGDENDLVEISNTRQNRDANAIQASIARTTEDELGAADAALEIEIGSASVDTPRDAEGKTPSEVDPDPSHYPNSGSGSGAPPPLVKRHVHKAASANDNKEENKFNGLVPVPGLPEHLSSLCNPSDADAFYQYVVQLQAFICAQVIIREQQAKRCGGYNHADVVAAISSYLKFTGPFHAHVRDVNALIKKTGPPFREIVIPPFSYPEPPSGLRRFMRKYRCDHGLADRGLGNQPVEPPRLCPSCSINLTISNVVDPPCHHLVCADCVVAAIGVRGLYYCYLCPSSVSFDALLPPKDVSVRPTPEDEAKEIRRLRSPTPSPIVAPRNNPPPPPLLIVGGVPFGGAELDVKEVASCDRSSVTRQQATVPFAARVYDLQAAAAIRRRRRLLRRDAIEEPWPFDDEFWVAGPCDDEHLGVRLPGGYGMLSSRLRYSRRAQEHEIRERTVYGIRSCRILLDCERSKPFTVCATLCPAIERLNEANLRTGLPLMRSKGMYYVPAPAETGALAPPPPPPFYCMAGDEEASVVTLYHITEIDQNRPIWEKALRFMAWCVPLVHPTEEWVNGDSPTDINTPYHATLQSTKGLGYRRGFLSVNHTSPLIGDITLNAGQTVYNAIFPSAATTYVFTDLVRSLLRALDKLKQNLNCRAGAVYADGKFCAPAGFELAVKRAIVDTPHWARYTDINRLILDETVRYFCQLHFFRGVRDLMTAAVPRGVAFRSGPRSREQRSIGAHSALAASGPYPLSSSSINVSRS